MHTLVWATIWAFPTMASFSWAVQIQPSLPFLQDKAYIIHDCGTRTDQIAIALELGKEPLEAAIKVAKQGTAGSHGFRSFWKTDANIAPVTKMLQDVHSLRPARGMRPNPLRAQLPEFVCATPDSVWRYNLHIDPLHQCLTHKVFGLWLRGYKYIFICDAFFTLKVSPIGPPSKYCVPVIGNRYDGNPGLLGDYQKYILIHELIHFYGGRPSLGWNTKPKETYRMNECVNMDPKNSLRSPMHWQFFIAMVEQNCIDEPDPFAFPFPFPPGSLAMGNSSDPSVLGIDYS